VKSIALLFLAACGGSSDVPVDTAAASCTLVADTTPTGRTTPSGCAILTRDTSACRADREAAGLTGTWLQFSCRVTLTVSGTDVIAVADGLPDFKSNYFATTDPCWESYTAAIQNPNTIAEKHYSLTIPMTPNTEAHTMEATGVVGLELDGVPIFGNFAAPGDDIYVEAATFDRCGGHPTPDSAYHHHTEPLSISYDDSNLIGVLRDGYPIYGRRDTDGSYPTLDTYGGHTSATADSDEPTYHYHVNEQTNGSGTSEWFLTTGTFRGAPGACTGC
jgi:hypothetical protein